MFIIVMLILYWIWWYIGTCTLKEQCCRLDENCITGWKWSKFPQTWLPSSIVVLTIATRWHVPLFLDHQIKGLVQDCSNSSANALELLQSCTKPLWLSRKFPYAAENCPCPIPVPIPALIPVPRGRLLSISHYASLRFLCQQHGSRHIWTW